jgi:hypothetical protein
MEAAAMTMPKDGYGRRIRRDKRADALRAARRVLDDGVTLRDAQNAAGVGRTYLKAAIAQLKAERAGGRP